MCNTMMKRGLLILFAAATLGVVGCGPKQYNINGTVSYNDAVLAKSDGVVIFVGPQSQQVEARINPDGTYQAIGVFEGLNKVAVYYKDPKVVTEKPHKPRPGDAPKSHPPLYLTPYKYASPDTSELSIDVTKESTFDIKMTGPPIE